MAKTFLLLVLSLIALSLSTAVRNIPLPLLFVGANRHRNEFKKAVKEIEAPQFKFRSALDNSGFSDQPINKGSLKANDEYMRHVLQMANGF
jgi:hypothetical protein